VDVGDSRELPPEAIWYLTHLDRALPKGGAVVREHPKIAATAQRVLELWRDGEKSVVFCFYVATGRALRAHISHAIEEYLLREAARQLRIDVAERDRVAAEVERLSLRFFDPDAPVTKAATATVQDLFSNFDLSNGERVQAVDVVLRFLRTPSFLVRYTNLAETNRVKAFQRALDKTDASGRSLRVKLEGFGQFLVDRIDEERAELLAALAAINTGAITTSADDSLLPGEDVDRREAILPKVRLANGGTSREARRRLMLTFNTPFFPEMLVSSAVMGEGVDLHHECRHTVHHDLDWNPSVLEQRTGRLDRLGSKAEITGLPIVVYEPFLEGTQDEKQFRVVKDRERWFNVVMGEKLELDERATERLAERVPLPAEAAEEIALRLEVHRGRG
jgi:Helicase conserved C-terminal domain